MSLANPPRVPVTFEAKKVTLEVAEELGIDIQMICEQALREEVTRRWQEANRGAIESTNAWIEKHGLPLERYRLF
jgi:antitoxin CcdA